MNTFSQEYEQKYAAAFQWEKDWLLPKLAGTDKQIKWAAIIRWEIYHAIVGLESSPPDFFVRKVLGEMSCTFASWWIRHRYSAEAIVLSRATVLYVKSRG